MPVVTVPVPESVPLTMTAVDPVAVPRVGLFPSGREQSLFTVFVPVVCVRVTRLNVALLHESVALELLKFSVPLLCVNVPPEIVKVLAILIVPLGAVKVPEDIVHALKVAGL